MMHHPSDAANIANSQIERAEMHQGSERGTGEAILALAQAVLALAAATKYVGDQITEAAKLSSRS